MGVVITVVPVFTSALPTTVARAILAFAALVDAGLLLESRMPRIYAERPPLRDLAALPSRDRNLTRDPESARAGIGLLRQAARSPRRYSDSRRMPPCATPT